MDSGAAHLIVMIRLPRLNINCTLERIKASQERGGTSQAAVTKGKKEVSDAVIYSAAPFMQK